MRGSFLFSFLTPTLASIVLGRNVGNLEEIEKYIEEFKVGDSRIDGWLERNLRKYLIRDFEEVRPLRGISGDQPEWLKRAMEKGEEVVVVSFPRYFTDKIKHAIDWFKSDDSPSRLDAVTVPEAIRQSGIWVKKLTKKKTDQEIAKTGEQVIKTYPDGYSWKKLTSPEALNREGELMNHCVGSYWSQVQSERISIVSLRDSKNFPHCTIEHSSSRVHQIKGNSNRPVAKEYRGYVKDLLDNEFKGLQVEEGELINVGLFRMDGKTLDLEEFRKNPEEVKLFVKKMLSHSFRNKEFPIEIIENNVYLFDAYLDEMVGYLDELGVDMNNIPKLMENFYQYSGTESFMEYVDVEEIIDSIKEKYPKTHEAIMDEIARVEEQTGDDIGREWGRWFNQHSVELGTLHDAVDRACYSGHEIGSENSMREAVAREIMRHKFADDSEVIENEKGTYTLIVPLESFIRSHEDYGFGGFGFRRDGGSIGGGRNGIEWNNEFDEKAAKEVFLEEIHAFQKEKGIEE